MLINAHHKLSKVKVWIIKAEAWMVMVAQVRLTRPPKSAKIIECNMPS